MVRKIISLNDTRKENVMIKIRIAFLSILLTIQAISWADGPKDNIPDQVRRIPRLGIEVSADKRKELELGLQELAKSIGALKGKKDARIKSLLPDVEIYYRAVHDALKYQEFFHEREVNAAFELLKSGKLRAVQLSHGESPWMEETGLVVRGYVSRIDGSVQPYGLVVPETYTRKTPHRYRVDICFHGRGETLSEVNFLTQRSKIPGFFTPPDTIVLHPYGRYSNAFKFAGEVDVLEALEAVKEHYRVDDDRISVRGFSMGGAACWQFAVHYSDRWFAANPGAGFSETPEFLKFFQKETLNPAWWEKKLWHMYDCTDWAANLHHCPTVAYSGELDIQKQAADIMAKALKEVDVDLVHVIGPETKHSYHPDAKREVEQRFSNLARSGRQRVPKTINFDTYNLKYNEMHWIRIDALKEHWERAQIYAGLEDDGRITIYMAENVTDLTIQFPPGSFPNNSNSNTIQMGIYAFDKEKTLHVKGARSDRSYNVQLHLKGDKWHVGPRPTKGLRKRHNLQGPIDDAFMDSFIFVRPTQQAWNASVDKWSSNELERAIEHWRRHFRGYARVKNDTEITEDDIESSNLILWGDPGSNKVLGQIADRLPIKWNENQIEVDQRRFASDHHAVIAIYPNPLNPNRYVVLNSSFTYRDFAYLNNARQVPKLPDWAIVDLRTPPDTLWPGKIVDADFFDESWQLKPPHRSD